MPVINHDDPDAPCCGPPAGPASGPDERPGYTLCQYVEKFKTTPAGPVPMVKTRLETRDILGTIKTRIGVGRNNYKISPGLYGTGDPDETSPVLVTANYKLTFDHVRRELAGVDAWILVLDTRGINVWCAAGKGTFATAELAHRIKTTGLDRVASHGRVILPQLGATGISAHEVKKRSGFKVIWGPVRINDIKLFLKNNMKSDKSMRQVTFTFVERLVLVPVEISLMLKTAFWVILALFLISGIGPEIFSLTSAWHRGVLAALSIIMGIVAGAVLAPILLPWVPGVSFALKGILTGAAAVIPLWMVWGFDVDRTGIVALLFFSVSVSSYLAMNFTGSTPFTSPSGVEKEMRRYIPVQAIMGLAGVVLWIYSSF